MAAACLATPRRGLPFPPLSEHAFKIALFIIGETVESLLACSLFMGVCRHLVLRTHYIPSSKALYTRMPVRALKISGSKSPRTQEELARVEPGRGRPVIFGRGAARVPACLARELTGLGVAEAGRRLSPKVGWPSQPSSRPFGRIRDMLPRTASPGRNRHAFKSLHRSIRCLSEFTEFDAGEYVSGVFLALAHDLLGNSAKQSLTASIKRSQPTRKTVASRKDWPARYPLERPSRGTSSLMHIPSSFASP